MSGTENTVCKMLSFSLFLRLLCIFGHCYFLLAEDTLLYVLLSTSDIKLSQGVKGHFVTRIYICMHQTTCNP